jgi:hypothetical protein
VSASFNVALPPSESIYSLWPAARHAVVLPQGYQAHIRDTTQAQLIALTLITILRKSEELSPQGIHVAGASTSSAWVIDCSRRLLRFCIAQGDTPVTDRDRVLAAILGVVWDIFELPCSKCKPGPFIELIIQLLWAFESCESSELQSQFQRCLPPLVGACSLHPRVLLECRRRLIPCLNEMTMDGKDRGNELEGFLRDGVRDPLISLDKKTIDDQPRPSKRLRIENTAPDPQERFYADKIRDVTVDLTGEHRTNLVGLRETAL